MTDAAPRTRPRHVRGRTIILGSAALIVAITVTAIALPLWQARHHVPTLEDDGVVPHFALTDETGATITEAALKGHVSVVDFVFTRCDSICPISSMHMRDFQNQTADTPDIKLLSFSVDPEYDTPPRLAEYAKRFEADSGRWHFVTGPLDAVKKVVTNAMMTSMEKDGVQPNGAPNILHGPHFLLIDPDLHIRGIYDSTEPVRLERLLRDARDLARATASR